MASRIDRRALFICSPTFANAASGTRTLHSAACAVGMALGLAAHMRRTVARLRTRSKTGRVAKIGNAHSEFRRARTSLSVGSESVLQEPSASLGRWYIYRGVHVAGHSIIENQA